MTFIHTNMCSICLERKSGRRTSKLLVDLKSSHTPKTASHQHNITFVSLFWCWCCLLSWGDFGHISTGRRTNLVLLRLFISLKTWKFQWNASVKVHPVLLRGEATFHTLFIPKSVPHISPTVPSVPSHIRGVKIKVHFHHLKLIPGGWSCAFNIALYSWKRYSLSN